MVSELEEARSKIHELEKGISDRDQAIQSERSHFDEKISSQSQEISKLKNNEKSLTIKAAESEALAEKTYKMGWDNAIAQMHHFFGDKDLNFVVLNEKEFLGDMLGERAGEIGQDESGEETLGSEEAQVEAQDESEVPLALIDDNWLDRADPIDEEDQATSADGGGQGAEEIPEAIIPEDREAVGRSDE